MDCDALTAICDESGREVLDVGNFGGLVVLGIPGVDRVACVEVGDLMTALQQVGVLEIDDESAPEPEPQLTAWRWDDVTN